MIGSRKMQFPSVSIYWVQLPTARWAGEEDLITLHHQHHRHIVAIVAIVAIIVTIDHLHHHQSPAL